jgi:peptidoglycan/xylan/chitin deacetylase (PgdA/CDA1 family)
VRLLKALIAWSQAQGLRWSTARVGIALVYHRVEERPRHPGGGVVATIATADFEGHVRHLARRYHPVAAGDLYPASAARRRGERLPVAITFDDDLRSHTSVALPLLRDHGVTATVFLCGASLDRPFSFWWERLERGSEQGVDLTGALGHDIGPAPGDLGRAALAIEALPAAARRQISQDLLSQLGPDPDDAGLRAVDVRALSSAAVEIGFHTRDHDRLTDLDDRSLAAALDDGRADLAAASGIFPTVLAYPHGRADTRVAMAARTAGYRFAFTAQASAVGPGSDPYLLGRLEASGVPAGHFPLWLARRFREGRRSC